CAGSSASFFCRAEDGIRDFHVTGVQTCALPIYRLAEYVNRFERQRDLVVQIIADARVQRSERIDKHWVASCTAVDARQELVAPVVSYAGGEPVVLVDARDVEAVAQANEGEHVLVRVRTTIHVHVTVHLGKRARDTEASVAEEVLTLDFEAVNVAFAVVDGRGDGEIEQRIVRVRDDVDSV